MEPGIWFCFLKTRFCFQRQHPFFILHTNEFFLPDVTSPKIPPILWKGRLLLPEKLLHHKHRAKLEILIQIKIRMEELHHPYSWHQTSTRNLLSLSFFLFGERTSFCQNLSDPLRPQLLFQQAVRHP